MEELKKFDHKKTVMVNTGKVLIGCAYQPPPAVCYDDDEYIWQAVMLNDRRSVKSAFSPVTNVLARMQKMFRIA